MLRATRTAFVALAVAGLFACGSPASRAAADASTAPSATVVSVNGSGCPAGTASATADPTALRVAYSGFTAKAGGVDARRNCQVAVRVVAAAGQQFEVTGTDYAGGAELPADSSALLRTSYYLQGTQPTTAATTTVAGPHTGAVDATQPASFTGPCGGDVVLNVNAEVRVSGGTATVDVTETHLAWKPC